MTWLARTLNASKRAAGLVAVLFLWLLAQLPLAASGPTFVLSESRVWAPAVENQTFTGADRLLSLESHRSNAPPCVLFASDCSVSPARTGAYTRGVDSGGSGLGRLTGEYRVSQRGMDIVEQHLSKFDDFAPNQQMIGRLRSALKDGRKISGADASFYFHELKEATVTARLMRGGQSFSQAQQAAHRMALDIYGVSPFSVYARGVVQANRGFFNRNWFKFWGAD